MLKIINNIITYTLPYIPKFIVKIFANKYIAGTTIQDAIKTIDKINKCNLKATADILGEHTTEITESQEITCEYIKLIKAIEKNKLDCNISLKLSHIGLDIDSKTMNENIKKIHDNAIKSNNFIRLDMENHKTTDNNIDTFLNENKRSNQIGIVFQAYLKRTFKDIEQLDNGVNIRLCKGIYIEPKDISYKNNEEINNNFLKLLELAFKKNIFVGIATHDETLINKCIKLIHDKKISSKLFEFQALYGVPINNTINKIKKNNYDIRIYVPFGQDWYKYSMRRLKENPNISKYILTNMFKRNLYT